jgi:hypothetical protein
MDWSRLGGAVVDALVISVFVGGLFSPPDPFTQLVTIPVAFLGALPLTYRYDPRIYDRGWDRHVLFVVFLLATLFVWIPLIRLEAVTPTLYSPIRIVVLLSGIALAGWLAYFDGLDRLRGESA